jgi:hypothetical protein
MADKTYNESNELKELAGKLVEKYYEYLGQVDLDNIYFAEIDGEKPKKAGVLQVGGISSDWVKKLIDDKVLYCISVWGSEWDELSPSMREWMVFDALLRIDPHNDGKLQKPDVNEFGIIIQYVGGSWRGRDDLPSLLNCENPLPIPLPKYDEDIGESFKLD